MLAWETEFKMKKQMKTEVKNIPFKKFREQIIIKLFKRWPLYFYYGPLHTPYFACGLGFSGFG